MHLVRAIGACVLLAGVVGCGGKPAAPSATQAKSEAAPVESPPAAAGPGAEAAPSQPVEASPGSEGAAVSPKTEPEPQAEAVATEPPPREIRNDNGLKMVLVSCPPGEFTMGSPKTEPGRSVFQEDQVQVTLTKGFWIGRTEVTQSQWKAVMGTEPWTKDSFIKQGATLPAIYMNWTDATAFCRKLTAQERAAGRIPADQEYRLPTEAEWEYACRAGTTTAYSCGDDVSKLGEYAWWGRFDGGSATSADLQPVGTRKWNPWGLFDMHGNVEEYCEDWFDPAPPIGGRDPVVKTGPSDSRVVRGGSLLLAAQFCRSAARSSSTWDIDAQRGFRVVLAAVRAAKSE